ncbi:hypothetical protein DCAR_0104727 [Daucus carota subsp. sativus]|uniref:Uncharacterized protein n=1 Tax=Daucus carota subsp. sativus TaxID=79200 RepID=A0A166J2H7_DAUCS|nr:PREDICTED: uncharacterized protein LOC108207619 [Daucus carota subsp. sativus]WOG85536.1 hypothetical protein DCAR_0104727 [Daucus carota subsp. sativus]
MGDLNLGDKSAGKRKVDEIGDDLEVGDRERFDFDGGGSGKKRCRGVGEGEIMGGCGRLNLGSGGSGIGRNEADGVEMGVGGKRGFRMVGEGETVGGWGISNLELGGPGVGRNVADGGVVDGGVIGGGEIGESSWGVEEKEEMSLDLNVPGFGDAGFVGCSSGVGLGCVVDDECVEVVNISSDESGDEGKELDVMNDYKGKGKVIEEGGGSGSNLGIDLYLGLDEIEKLGEDVSGSMGGGRRYSREEKGKAKVVESWMSLGGDSMGLDLNSELQNESQPTIFDLDLMLPDVYLQNEVIDFLFLNSRQDLQFDQRREQEAIEFELRRQQEAFEFELRRQQEARELWLREQQEAWAEHFRQRDLEDLMRAGREFARPLGEKWISGTEQNLQYTALNKQLISWKPSEDRDKKNSKRFVPSLLDLSMKILADNADAIVSLEGVPDSLKRRLSDRICDMKKMNAKILDLFVRGSPEEIRVKDASLITDRQFKTSFGNFAPKNLRVFQFDLCGQCVLDDTIADTLVQSLSSLPTLGIISLRGACRLSDDALKNLVELAPFLCSINLGENALITHVGIHHLANALGTSLRELFIDNCSLIDGSYISSALKKFEHLEVLSIAGISNICDKVVSDIITARGRNIKDLNLADCVNLTDYSLNIIGQNCSGLRSLNIENLDKLTNMGLSNLANGCKSIRTLKLCRNKFSDEAIAAFIDTAGRSLEQLSLNRVSQVGSFTALSLAKISRKLMSLDLSWCRKVTDEALGLLVDSCWSLKLLKLFGCTQITNVFLDGHSNSLVRIIGLYTNPLLEDVGMLDAEEVYLRYSPLPVPVSENLDHQDV